MAYLSDRRIRIPRRRAMAGLGDSNVRPDGSTCDSAGAPGDVYVAYYDSCVTPCPSGQSYNAQGVCAGPTAASSSSGGSTAGSILGSIFGSVGKVLTTQTPTVLPSTGIDTTTLLVVGALGIGAVLLLTRKPSASSGT